MKQFSLILTVLFVHASLAAVTEKLIKNVNHRVTRDDRGVLLESINSPLDVLKKLNIDKRRLQLSLNGTSIESEYLSLHNQYRSNVAQGDTDGHPSAEMMNKLFWDPALAAVAQAYADQCVYEHNPDRTSDLQSYENIATFKFDDYSLSVGENLYAATYPESLEWILYGITLWYDEYQYYTFDTQACSDVCGHYTQIVWDDTRYVGCAYSMCDPLSGVSWTSESIYLVCNYFPAGNFNGNDPYVEGDECTNCDSDRNDCEDGLCAGCMSEWYSYCSDYFGNCESLSGSCPANCTLTDTSSMCTGCRTSCGTCTTSMLSSDDTCDDGTGIQISVNNGNKNSDSSVITFVIIGACLLGGVLIAVLIVVLAKNKSCVVIQPQIPVRNMTEGATNTATSTTGKKPRKMKSNSNKNVKPMSNASKQTNQIRQVGEA